MVTLNPRLIGKRLWRFHLLILSFLSVMASTSSGENFAASLYKIDIQWWHGEQGGREREREKESTSLAIVH